MASSYKSRQTPGVYITELPAFPPSVIGVATAIPVFIGYTEKAQDPATGASLFGQPVQIASMQDYHSYFGAGFSPLFDIVPATADRHDFTAQGAYYDLVRAANGTFHLYDAVRLFYANGGATCYVVACAAYGPIALQDLQSGLTAGANQVGPTLVVIPDACELGAADFATLSVAQLNSCSALQDRMAILDLQGCTDPAGWDATLVEGQAAAFYEALGTLTGSASCSYGAAYYPALKCSIVPAGEVSFVNLNLYGKDQGTAEILARLLLAQVAELYPAATQPGPNAQALAAIARMLPGQVTPPPGVTPVDPVDPANPTEVQTLNQALLAALPLMGQIEAIILADLNVQPPSGAMAGLFALNDQNRGVWNAPANMVLQAVVSSTIPLTDAMQEPLNVPLNGLAINVIRDFVNRGPTVWGARTLDGNSNDYRYIQVRRTLIYIEQSIKNAINPFVFAANDGQTWTTVTAMISNFLQGVWSQGGLMGDKASDAFTVQCGLGSTMTAQNILDGFMVVSVTLQMVHPAEFIELTFTQVMGGGA